ncbi:MAG: hypothetical protein SPK50_05020 [Mobiluncus porci]|uniref:hypothetical protein n=1 Tax=Mobiluncus porci TaxID=2652278 RepID=UPI0023F3842A|nr:hypothetical protein [Mobiluncus porci]MDD7541488.1 hypothetical protein [Mobiluncus porci]MDY5748473.1 hypothetical protein [Mobiluncus porci]
MVVLRKLAAGAAALGLSTLMAGTAFASAGQWTGSQQHYNIYSVNQPLTVTSTFLAPSSVTTMYKATAVNVSMVGYSQTVKQEDMRLCYTLPFGTRYAACTPFYEEVQNQTVSGDAMGSFLTVDAQGGYIGTVYTAEISAKGEFTVEHRFPDGVASAIYNDPGYDTISVSFVKKPY